MSQGILGFKMGCFIVIPSCINYMTQQLVFQSERSSYARNTSEKLSDSDMSTVQFRRLKNPHHMLASCGLLQIKVTSLHVLQQLSIKENSQRNWAFRGQAKANENLDQFLSIKISSVRLLLKLLGSSHRRESIISFLTYDQSVYQQ